MREKGEDRVGCLLCERERRGVSLGFGLGPQCYGLEILSLGLKKPIQYLNDLTRKKRLIGAALRHASCD